MNRIEAFLIDEAHYTAEDVLYMTKGEKMDAWLNYLGIIGYTDKILEAIDIVYNLNINIK